jgi:hypothetical protein
MPQALLHRGDPDPARPVPAQSHLESPQVLGHRAARREGSQLCRQVHRSLVQCFSNIFLVWHRGGTSVEVTLLTTIQFAIEIGRGPKMTKDHTRYSR